MNFCCPLNTMESDINSSGIQWYTMVYNPFPTDTFIQICSERITPLSPLFADLPLCLQNNVLSRLRI